MDTTELLVRWGEGDVAARDELVPRVYAELRAIAQRQLAGERAAHTLSPTALVHEAYLRLVDQERWQNRNQFFAIAANVIRRVLVDHARVRGAAKRGAGLTIQLDAEVPADERAIELVRIDEALARLAEIDPEGARVVELRYFAGLSIEETAEATATSPATVKREWTFARAWLRRALLEDDA